MRKFHQAVINGENTVQVWGSGRPRREFLHVDDMASASRHLMALSGERYWSGVSERCSHVNVGCGTDVSITELAELMARITGFQGNILYQPDMPDGTPRKLLDVNRLTALGWTARISLEQGMQKTYEWMVEHWREIDSDE